jgi:TPR repeat protein
MYNLGQLAVQGRGMAVDVALAARLYRGAAEGGHAQAMSTLGALLGSGLGVGRDPREAALWILRGEEAGDRWFRSHFAAQPVEVRIEVQRLLRAAGRYSGPLDGTFGPEALAALRAHAGE